MDSELPLLDEIYNASIPELWLMGQTWIVEEFSSNDFLIGILVPVIITWVAYAGRGLVMRVLRYIRMMVTSEITFNSDNTYYHELTKYLFTTSVTGIFQRFFILTHNWNDDKLSLTVGYGRSFGFIGIWPVIINRSREESTSAHFKELVSITIIGGRKTAIKKLIDDTQEMIDEIGNTNTIKIYTIGSDGSTSLISKKPPRSLDTVIIPKRDKEYIISKIDYFVSSESYHIEKGLPYHLGIILSGPPGTGKTSLIHAIASHYNRDICFHKGGTLHLDDFDAEKSILVIEDIDSNGMNVQKRDDKSESAAATDVVMSMMTDQSMSSILNTLDGLLSPHGMITIATTNQYDSLDEAIVRPGRFDVHVELLNMKWPEWVALGDLLNKDIAITEEEYTVVSPAQARYVLLYYTPDLQVEYFKKLKEEK